MYNVYYDDGALATRVPCETFEEALEYAYVLSAFDWGWYIRCEDDGRVLAHYGAWSYHAHTAPW